MKNVSFVCLLCWLLVGCTVKGDDWYVSNDLGVVDTFQPQDTSTPEDTGPTPDVSDPVDVEQDAGVEDTASPSDTAEPVDTAEPEDTAEPVDTAEPEDTGGPTAPTWNDNIVPIFQGPCSLCHSAGQTPFMAQDAALNQSPVGSYGCSPNSTMPECIYELVETQQMPPGCVGQGTCITGIHLETIKAWVDAGAPL